MRFSEKNQCLIPEPRGQTEGSRKLANFPEIPQPPLQSKFSFNPALQQYLSGKRLLPDELPFSFSEIQTHYENGYIQYGHGVCKINHTFRCERCGNEKAHLFGAFDCARCGEECAYCRKCLMMGRVSECTPFMSWSGPDIQSESNSSGLSWQGTLSKGQQAASDKVVEAILQKSPLLVWAVCGAGKTEVLFAGIQAALSLDHRVCIATPRTDVVLELSPRLQEVFPQTEIATLYGGSEDRTKNAALTISTTHQLLRYFHAFDTVIIDEVDAFPFSIDPMLQHAAEQARKSDGSLIYLSATPSKAMQKAVRRQNLQAVLIPARYHGKPLPVPSFEWSGNWRKTLEKKQRLPDNVKRWIFHHHLQSRPIFLFVPHIALLEKAVELLKKQYGAQAEGVHAQDSDRKDKVSRFREGKIRILVTTTILERGVTVPNVQVGVLGAEDETFTESALVQIAGRAGRNKSWFSGDVRYFHYGKTLEMIAARDHIRRMNYRAKQGGFLKEPEDE